MATNPRWQRGADTISCRATPVSADAAGTLANGTVVLLLPKDSTVAGVLDDISYNGRSLTEDIAPLTSPMENQFEVERDDAVVLTEILRSQVNQNLLAKLMFDTVVTAIDAEYIYFELYRGQDRAAAATLITNRLQFYGSMTEYRETIRKGKSTAQMTIEHIEAGATLSPNPTYSQAAISTIPG